VWENVKADRVGRQAKARPGELSALAEDTRDRLAGAPNIVRGFFGDPHLASSN
jgi:hypothetical protein